MQSTNRRYVPLLDVLRACAALWVVLYHTVIRFTDDGTANMWPDTDNPVMVVLSQGWLGVTVFVMLSGFSLSLGVRRGDIAWGGYFAARWLRVAPLYLVVLFLGTLATPAAEPTAGSFLAALTMLPVPDAFSPGPWMATAWSVRIELVLYLFIPAFVYAARRYRPAQIAAMGAVLAAGAFAALLPTTSVIDILYWGLPGRLVEFAAGFALGYAGRSVGARLRPVALAVSAIGFAAAAYVCNRSGGFYDVPDGTRIAVYAATLLLGVLLLSAVDLGGSTSRSRLLAGAAAVGTWSYSIYLWHAVLINLVVAPLLFDRPTPLGERTALAAGMALTVVLVVVVSWASFSLIEQPFLAMRPKYVRAATPDAVPALPVHDGRGPELVSAARRTLPPVPQARRPERVGAGA